CFVVDVWEISKTVLNFDANFAADTGCVQPAPFWGACCLNGQWFSSSDKSLDLAELADTRTFINHTGSVSLKNAPASFLNSNLSFMGGVEVSGGYLNISNTVLGTESTLLSIHYKYNY